MDLQYYGTLALIGLAIGNPISALLIGRRGLPAILAALALAVRRDDGTLAGSACRALVHVAVTLTLRQQLRAAGGHEVVDQAMAKFAAVPAVQEAGTDVRVLLALNDRGEEAQEMAEPAEL